MENYAVSCSQLVLQLQGIQHRSRSNNAAECLFPQEHQRLVSLPAQAHIGIVLLPFRRTPILDAYRICTVQAFFRTPVDQLPLGMRQCIAESEIQGVIPGSPL